jgi:hypothetical protein
MTGRLVADAVPLVFLAATAQVMALPTSPLATVWVELVWPEMFVPLLCQV